MHQIVIFLAVTFPPMIQTSSAEVLWLHRLNQKM